MAQWKSTQQKNEPKPSRRPGVIIGFLESRRDSKTGGLKIGLEFNDYLKALTSCVEFSSILTDTETEGITSGALLDLTKHGELTEDKVLAEITSREKKILALNVRKFSIATNISISFDASFKILGTTFTFFKHLPEVYERAWAEKLVAGRVYSQLPKRYGYLITEAFGRTEQQAAKVGLFTIDKLRAIWNLYFNKGRRTIAIAAPHRPMNSILRGPLQTLHNTDGTKGSDLFWYDPGYIAEHKIFDLGKSMPECMKFTRTIFRNLNKYDKTEVISNAFVRYARACDCLDYNTAILKLWGVMELLTTGSDSNHLDVVKRASRIYSDAPLAFELLQYLRDYRNFTSHTGQEVEGLDYTANQLRAFVEQLLIFHVSLIKQLNGVDGVRETLALAASEDAVVKRLRALESTRRIMFPRVKFKSKP